MRLIEAIRAAATVGGAERTCFGCARFHNDVATVERHLPGLSSFSSAHASVRADDGLCARHETWINGRRACADFEPAPR
jgi:hypothetical protein